MIPLQKPHLDLVENGGLATTFIHMAEPEAIALAKEHFGFAGRVTRFATEKDDTFRLDTTDGRRFVLKVANPSETAGEIGFQTELLDHLAKIDASLPTPRIVRSIGGETHFPIVDRAGQSRRVRLMSYLEGTPLDSTHASATQLACVGEMLARLRLATAGFSHEGENRILAWDVRHLLGLEHLLEFVEDGWQRKRLKQGLVRFAAATNNLPILRTQVLHNDFSKSNIVVDHAGTHFVTGIIDFGDAVRTAIAIDVSTALLNQLPSDVAHLDGDIFAAGRDLLRGYLRVADLHQEELALLPHLTMGRIIARALLTIWRAKLFPHNAVYILRNTPQGWRQLDWFLQRSPEEVSKTFLRESI